jgi:hypothetical protein
MESLLHHGFESGTESERRLSGSGTATQRDDADTVIEKKVESDPLFCRSSVKSKSLAISTHQLQLLICSHASKGASLFRVENDSGVYWKLMCGFMVCAI